MPSMSETRIVGGRCPIAPAGHGSPEWIENARPLAEAFAEKGHADAVERADDYLWQLRDTQDLRALGFCRQCGVAITLQQVGRCVYSVPCDHYRAQGELARMRPYITANLAKLTPEREAALLALIGRAPVALPPGGTP